CPWESLSSEQPPENPCAGSPALPKAPSKKSQSEESLKAEVCPWEAPEAGAAGKAEICPWEVAEAPSDQQKAKLGPVRGKSRLPPKESGASKHLEKGSSERESICPWESLSMEETSPKTATRKEPSKK
ncbi:GP179 protein, partial [Chloroceryle aenea]|nr:GP179 protein [Chloroceryle aenea]